MDKIIIFAVAGSGKTSHIVNSLSQNKRSLIITYTNNNYDNLSKKIIDRFGGSWPENITLMTYFQFLFHFCYKPFLADRIKARGIVFDSKLIIPETSMQQREFYLTKSNYFHSCRLSLFLQKCLHKEIQERIRKYFDEFIIDEIQDIAGRDFNFLESLMETNVNMLFVGDFYQHTFDTSRDGNVNNSLFTNRDAYEKRFTNRGFILDSTSFVNSWRCGKDICDFVLCNLGIRMASNKGENDNSRIAFISDRDEIRAIINNPTIVKLHYQRSNKFGLDHRNWGETKGEDKYQDVCVALNKNTMRLYYSGKLYNLAASTRNKLYVAITRAHRNVYLIEEDCLAKL